MTDITVPELNADSVGSMAAGKYTASFVYVTPELAASWLKANTHNRKIKAEHLRLIVEDMQAGRWEFDGATIRFSADGVLLDGQHRLAAVVEYGSPILMLVVRGLTERSQDVMDTGSKRSAADMFKMKGKDNVTLRAAVTRLVASWKAGDIVHARSSVRSYSNAYLRDLEATDPSIAAAVVAAGRFDGHIAANPGAIGLTFWLAANKDQAAAEEFFTAIAELRTDGSDDPRLTLIRRLQAIKNNREKTTSVEQAFYIIRTWNAWRTGSPMRGLKSSTSAGPVAFPEAL